MPDITKIVITGGPCAGKTTAMSRIQREFTELGYTVLFIAETATELIGSGVAPWACRCGNDFQRCQIALQLDKEKAYGSIAASMPADKILIVCDRGMMDNKAYMEESEFLAALNEHGLSEVEVRDSYDAVFHLVTAAKGAGSFYTIANNSARTESPQEAAALDDSIIAAWTGHPHLRVIDNTGDFETKMDRLLTEISSFLGEPEHFEIERKFLIAYPDLDWLASLPTCKQIEIIQTYLSITPNEEVRIRQRGNAGHYIYFQTTKRNAGSARRVELERRLSQTEYRRLLASVDPAGRQLTKTRYCLLYEGQYFEIDIYPFWDDRAIVEIELSDKNAAIHFPPELHIIREVTDDDSFKSAALVSRMDAAL